MKRDVILACDQKLTRVKLIYSTEQQLTGENRKSGKLESKNGYAQKYRYKQSGESVESVQEKERFAEKESLSERMEG